LYEYLGPAVLRQPFNDNSRLTIGTIGEPVIGRIPAKPEISPCSNSPNVAAPAVSYKLLSVPDLRSFRQWQRRPGRDVHRGQSETHVDLFGGPADLHGLGEQRALRIHQQPSFRRIEIHPAGLNATKVPMTITGLGPCGK
jgi:hypothetical protein